MTLAEQIIAKTVPGEVYSPAQVAKLIGYERTSNVKKTLDDLVLYHYFDRWKKPKRYHGRETYAYMRLDN